MQTLTNYIRTLYPHCTKIMFSNQCDFDTVEIVVTIRNPNASSIAEIASVKEDLNSKLQNIKYIAAFQIDTSDRFFNYHGQYELGFVIRVQFKQEVKDLIQHIAQDHAGVFFNFDVESSSVLIEVFGTADNFAETFMLNLLAAVEIWHKPRIPNIAYYRTKVVTDDFYDTNDTFDINDFIVLDIK